MQSFSIKNCTKYAFCSPLSLYLPKVETEKPLKNLRKHQKRAICNSAPYKSRLELKFCRFFAKLTR